MIFNYVIKINEVETNLAIYGELGRYPLYIDTIISIIKYWVRLCKNTHHDPGHEINAGPLVRGE
jgi:hypothetical protein